MKGNQTLGGERSSPSRCSSRTFARSPASARPWWSPARSLDFLERVLHGHGRERDARHQGVRSTNSSGTPSWRYFGAPVPTPEDPLHAVKAALEMRARLIKINVAFKARGLPGASWTGIGLHSGQVVAGNMGHAERMEYTVIGDAVNLVASRLESMTKELNCDV